MDIWQGKKKVIVFFVSIVTIQTPKGFSVEDFLLQIKMSLQLLSLLNASNSNSSKSQDQEGLTLEDIEVLLNNQDRPWYYCMGQIQNSWLNTTEHKFISTI